MADEFDSAPEAAQPVGDLVNVVGPDGTPGAIPAHQVQQAVEDGYSLAQPHEVDAHFHDQDIQAKYGTTSEMLKTGAEGVAKGFLGPLATGAELAAGVKPEDIRGREEANPKIHGIAEAGSFLGSAITGTGEAGLLSKIGESVAAAGDVGKIASEGRMARAGAEAAKAAFEGALFQGGEELHRSFIEDPEHPAQNAIAHIGMASVLSGLFGGTIGAALGKAAPEAENLISQVERPAFEAGEIGAVVKNDLDIKPTFKDKVLQAIKVNKEKPDAAAYKSAAGDLGLPVPSGSTLESPYVDMALDNLSKRPYTVSGNAVRTNLDEAWTKATGTLESNIGSDVSSSVNEIGDSVKSSIAEKVRARYEPVKQGYKELEELHPLVPIEKDMVAALGKELRDIKEVKLGAATEEGRLARQVLKASENVQTAEDISTLRNSSMLKDLTGPTNKDPLSYIKTVIKDKLETMQNEALDKHAASFPRNDEAGGLFKSLISKNQELKAAYKPHIQTLSELSQWLGKGSIRGTEGALHFLEHGLSATDVAKRLFSAAKDPEFARFFSKNFPEEYEAVRQYQRAAFKDAAGVGDAFKPKQFIQNFNDPKKLSPEIKKALYSADEISKVDKLHTYYKNAFPKNWNPSGTAHVVAFDAAHLGVKGFALANLRDAGLKAMIERAAATGEGKQAVELAQATIKGDRAATKAVKSIFGAAKEIPTNIIPLAAARSKLNKLVDQAIVDPTKLVAMNDNNHSVPEYNQAFAASAARVVNYLASVKPNTQATSPLDPKRIPSSVEIAQYNRALDIAENPLTVLSGLKDARITPSDIVAMHTMYPKLYNSIATKLTSGMVDAVHKGQNIPYSTRIGLSLFLGQPLDSTMTPEGIMRAQMQFMKQAQKGSQEQLNGSKPPSEASTKGLSKLPSTYQTPSQQRQSARSTGKH